MNLITKFDAAYKGVNQPMPDLDAYISGDESKQQATDFSSFELPESVALEMLNAEETYWGHYGWFDACMDAIYQLASDGEYAKAQQHAQWIFARKPQGLEKMPRYSKLTEYINGTFPTDEFEKRNAIAQMLKTRIFEEEE